MLVWMVSLAQATNEIMRLLGLHSNYSSLSEGERMKLLAEAISAPPPVDKHEVFMFHSLQTTFLHRSYETVQTYRPMQSVY